MNLNDVPDELSAAAIARLAGVSRAAVTGWRNRYPDFPAPIGGTLSRPTFARAAVVKWLVETGKAAELAIGGRTNTGTHLTAEDERLRRLREQLPEPSITTLTPARLLARTMAALLPRTTAAAGDPVDFVGPFEGAPDDFDDTAMLPDDAEGSKQDDEEHATRELILSGNGDEEDLPVVLDPACGDAMLLTAVGDRFGRGVRLVGQDMAPSTANRAALQLRVMAHQVPYDIRIGDSMLADRLGDYLGKAAAVVCDPPFAPAVWPWSELTGDPRWTFGEPGARDVELAWVQHCYAYLRPRGMAVVAVSPHTCVSTSGRSVRAALVRSGALCSVIALPKGVGSSEDTEACLWVLQRPYGLPDRSPVRIVDLSRLTDAAEVPYDFATWQQLFDAADPGTVRMVPRLDVLDADADLLPSRYVTPPAAADVGAFTEVADRLQALYSAVGRCLPRFNAPPAPHRHSLVSFAELERTGALSIRSRDTTPRAGDLLMRALGLPPAVATGTEQDEANVAYVVEIDETRLDAHFVAAFLRADANAQPVTNTLRMVSREKLRRCRIPRMPISEQRRYGDAFRRLTSLEQTISALAATSSHVINETTRALIIGVLEPDLSSSALRASTDTEMRNP